jgi:hypothetical protein
MLERDQATNLVALQGEQLDKTIWLGRQWAVTEYGIEQRDGTYAIEADRLDENDWFDHMAQKEWVNLSDFAAALYIARYIHRGEV